MSIPTAEIHDHAAADRTAGHAASRTARDERRPRVDRPRTNVDEIVDVQRDRDGVGRIRPMPAASE